MPCAAIRRAMDCVEPAMQRAGVTSQPLPTPVAAASIALPMTPAATTRRTYLTARAAPLGRAVRSRTAARQSCDRPRNARVVKADAPWCWEPRAPRTSNARAVPASPRRPVHKSAARWRAPLRAAPARAAGAAASIAKEPGPNAWDLSHGRAPMGPSTSRSVAMAATPRRGCAPSSARPARSARSQSSALPEHARST